MIVKRLILALCLFGGAVLSTTADDPRTPQEHCDAAEPSPLSNMQFEKAGRVLERHTDFRAILCTSAGAIYVDLYENLTPITVNNFVFLAGQDYYDSTTFHRVIPDFMAQAGDPTGSGRGGPGYQFPDEPIGFLTFDRPGLLAMANAGPGTNGSQFFITTAPTPHLNYKHTIFGDVLLGQDAVEAIRERDPATASEAGETLETVLVISDPSQVDNSDVIELEPAEPADVVLSFEAFADALPPTLLISEGSGFFDAAAAAAAIPSHLQEAYAAYADARGYLYSYRQTLLNGSCDSSVFFSSLAYQVDVFEGGAAAALNDGFERKLLQSQGYALDDSLNHTYIRPMPTCAGEDGLQALRQYNRGRFLVTIAVLVEPAVLQGLAPLQLLNYLSVQIEGAFADIYLPEIR